MRRLFSNIPLKWQLFYYTFSHVRLVACVANTADIFLWHASFDISFGCRLFFSFTFKCLLWILRFAKILCLNF